MSSYDPFEAFRLDGKVALVTGGSRGLGRRIARALAGAGASVMIAGRDEQAIGEAARAIADECGVRAEGFAGDLTERDTAKRLVSHTVERLGGLHIVVNNAGINIRGPIESVTAEDYERVMATNVRAPWLLCRAAQPILCGQGFGRVINLASALGLVAIADRSLYCMSKGALVQLTRELAVEWAEKGVTVNAICPGPFETEMNLVLTKDAVKKQQFADHTAMRRWGRMDEIEGAVLFLASPSSSYVTGSIVSVDGGWVVK